MYRPVSTPAAVMGRPAPPPPVPQVQTRPVAHSVPPPNTPAPLLPPPPSGASQTPQTPGGHVRTVSSGSACRYGHGSLLSPNPTAPNNSSPARNQTPTPRRHQGRSRSRSRSVGPGGRSRSQTPQDTDPGMLRGPGKLFRMIHYGDLLKATRDFRTALHLVARSGEVFGRIVDALADCRSPHEDDPIPHDLLADAEFLADTVRLVSGTHQLLGDMIWRDLETPMQRDLDDMNRQALAICTQYNNVLVKLRPEVAKAAAKVTKLRSKRKRQSHSSSSSSSTATPAIGVTAVASWTEDSDPLVHAERAHAVLEGKVIRLEHEISTTGDRMAAPKIHDVIRRIGPVARGTIAGYTNLAQAVSAMTEVGHTRAATARQVGPLLTRVDWDGPEDEWMATAPHSRRTTAGSVGPAHKRTVTWATAASVASIGQRIQSTIPEDATGEVAKRHVKTSIFSLLSTELNAAPAV